MTTTTAGLVALLLVLMLAMVVAVSPAHGTVVRFGFRPLVKAQHADDEDHVTVRLAVVADQASADGTITTVSFPTTYFNWTLDPNATLPCTSEPGCYNSVVQGFVVEPLLNIHSDLNVVFQTDEWPSPELAAILRLIIKTQVGCFVSGCHVMPSINPQEPGEVEECYNELVSTKPNQPDGGVLLEFGGIYYQDSPMGELYVKFETQNYLHSGANCSYDVVSGFKRWF